jgi:hypothetical protein
MPGQDTLDPASQVLLEIGRLQAENEMLRAEKAAREQGEQAEVERKRQRNQEALRPVCRLRWINQPQNFAASVGDRIYKGHGPIKDRATQRVLKPGSEFEAPADDARVLEESGYAEIIQGREHVTNWTPTVVIPADAAPAPAAGDSDAWNALVVHG